MTSTFDEESMPLFSPAPLSRSYTNSVGGDHISHDIKTRYLQYECNYKTCKHPGMTWGWIAKNDYEHFVHLMKTYVPRDSNTFTALQSELRPDDLGVCVNTTRHYDTEDGKKESQNIYLGYTCSHNGRMGGKTWKEILSTDYEYFCWAVGNTMGRDTRTFEVLLSCVKPRDQAVISKTPKGKYRVKKKKKKHGQATLQDFLPMATVPENSMSE